MAKFRSFSSNISYSGVATPEAAPISSNNTDVINVDVKLYIEGVEVKFEAISISQFYQGRPTASIQIPPASGLLDIIRGYEPKVHIFYKDDIYGGYRLLFWGTIKASSYSRSRSQGSTYITFQCEHKNAVMSQLTMDYSGWASPMNESSTDNNSRNAFKPNSFNSNFTIIQALTGINGVASESEIIRQSNTGIELAPVDKLDPSLEDVEKRLIGMPGVAVNLWNQMRRDTYTNRYDQLAMSKMYIPLIDEGIAFFKRVSGHTFLERNLQNRKAPYCIQKTTNKQVDIIVPPYFRTSMISALQQELSAKTVMNMVGFSGELMSFEQLIFQFFNVSKYDILTLASPAEVAIDPETFVDKINEPGVEKSTIETIIKPQIPFYYSPICNVLLPRMYHTLQISQNEGVVPTRISASHDAMPTQSGPGSLDISFKGPASFREAVAYNAKLKGVNVDLTLNLGDTKGNTFFIPSKYEQGIGIRHEKITLPWWLVLLSSDKSNLGTTANMESVVPKASQEYLDMLFLNAEWKRRYCYNITQEDDVLKITPNPQKFGLNPFDPQNRFILPHERIMYPTMDYEFSQRVAGSRSGSVDGIFNPYIIPGYPMDIVDDSPNHPSFHAFCTSVTHSITSRSISTSIAFVNATTYAELSNYYTPPLSPFLQTALGLINGELNEEAFDNPNVEYGSTTPVLSTASVLIQNPKAKAAADQFYRGVLGVGAAAPDDLIHFASNRAYPVERKAGTLIPQVLKGEGALPAIQSHAHQARETNDYYSGVGNLRLVSRPIESRDSISSKFNYNFIDVTPLNFNSSFVNYVNPKLASNFFLEPGASLFLDYMEVDEFIKS